MTAIATDKLKFKYTDLLYNEIISASDSNHYYIGVGKSDQYDSADDTIINPVRTAKDEMDARNNLESIIKVAEASMSYIVPRYNWTSGTVYSAWSDHQVGYPTNAYYVMTDDQQVYLCLANSRSSTGAINPSTVKPSYAAHSPKQWQAFKTSDNYIWKFLYEITAARSNTFLSSGYMPTQQTDSATSSGTAETDQDRIRSTAKGGQILGVEIIEAGAGYNGTVTAAFTGSGSGAIGTVTLNGDKIGKIDMTCVVGDSGMGSGYDYAKVKLTGGTPTKAAVLRPILSPHKGFGTDVRQDLKSSSLMFNVKPTGTQSGAFSVTTTGTYGGQSDFRQVSLLRNINYVDSAGTPATGQRVTQAQARTNRIVITNAQANFQKDEKLTGGTSGTIAWIDHIDSVNRDTGAAGLAIHYHFNTRKDLAPGSFTTGETITGGTSGVSTTVDSDSQPDKTALAGTQTGIAPINKYSGEVLYIDNRTRVIRSSTQTEDIKVILSV